MSSMSPLAGRLSEIFSPRTYVVFSCVFLSIGLFITAVAKTLTVFLVGRTIAGCGSGGVMSTSIILALDLSSYSRRGLCLGMVNASFTTGVMSGAILAGLITPAFGWVRVFARDCEKKLTVTPL